MANKQIEAILRISSKLGSMRALNTLQKELGKVDRQAKAFSRTQTVVARTSSAAFAATARFIAPMAVAYGAKRAVTEYAAVERRLNRIAINADLGRDAVAGMLKTINRISHDYAMSQDQVTAGLEELVAAGRSADDALSFLPTVTATAQASGAAIADIATTADAVGNSFDITASKMQHAFDILVASGKMGKFELRDMAQYLPSMAPAFAALGYKGEAGLSKLAAMLQTIRQRTGSASEAATAAQNIFQKMESDQTVKKFKDFGIDLRKELARAREEGRDLIDTFLDLSQKATKGDLSKIPQLFTDAQFQIGMRALMQGRIDMEGFQKALEHVDGATLKDLSQVLSDSQTKIDQMASAWGRFTTSFGTAISDPVTGALDAVTSNLDYGEALREGLKKRGMSYLERENWIFRHTFDTKAKNLAAFEGGWRSKEGKKAEGGTMEAAVAARAAERSQGHLPVQDANNLPATVPVPGQRPDPNMVLPELRLDRFVPPSPEGMRAQIEAERRQALAALDNAGSGGIRAAMMGDAGDLGEELRQGGEAAGRSIGDAGDQAGSAISSAAGAIVAAGEQAAAAIRAAAKDPMRPLIGSLRPQRASGNPGRTMPHAGIAGGPR